MQGRGPWVLAFAALVAVALAGCGTAATSSDGTASSMSGASASKSASVIAQTGRTAAVAPGHDTPEDAADGAIQNELSGHIRQACSYFIPSQQASCRKAPLILLPKGHVSVVGAVTSGDLALVEIIGRFCTRVGNHCQTGTDPSAGMPDRSETFKQAFDKAYYGSEFSPVNCQKVHGKWYVDAVFAP